MPDINQTNLVERLRARAEALNSEYDKRGDSTIITLDEMHIFDALCRLDEAADAIEALSRQLEEAKADLEECRRDFRDASDSYSRLRWPDTTGQ